MLNNLLKIIKRRFLFFLLFLPTTSLIVAGVNDLLYTFTQNSRFLFYLILLLLLLIFVTFFVLVFHFIEEKLPKKYLKLIFKSVVIIGLIILSCPSLIYLFAEDLFTYKSCGKEFNQAYVSSAKNNDLTFCLDSNIQLNDYTSSEGGRYCKTPNKDSIYVNYFSLGCIASFAKYTNDISHCEMIASHNLSTAGSSSSSDFERNEYYYYCIMDFAVDKLNDSYCDLLPSQGEFSDRNQCLRMIAWKSNNIALCEKIPESSSLRSSCFENTNWNTWIFYAIFDR